MEYPISKTFSRSVSFCHYAGRILGKARAGEHGPSNGNHSLLQIVLSLWFPKQVKTTRDGSLWHCFALGCLHLFFYIFNSCDRKKRERTRECGKKKGDGDIVFLSFPIEHSLRTSCGTRWLVSEKRKENVHSHLLCLQFSFQERKVFCALGKHVKRSQSVDPGMCIDYPFLSI